MENKIVHGKTIKQWKAKYPLMNKIIATQEVFWTNPNYNSFNAIVEKLPLTQQDVKDAEERLKRFAPYIAQVFPETKKSNGIIESPVVKISKMKSKIEEMYNVEIPGKLLMKCDNQLAISGSIKARGGIYEVLKHAEDLAIAKGILNVNDNYLIFNSDKFKELFSHYSIAVGSTGNLGLSIGIMGARLGFKVYVHMSADARKWKKDLLRSKGVTVIEYSSDYSLAVKEGRKQALADENMYFIDDENSSNLFSGYAVAAFRLKNQLEELKISVDTEHPLFVYLPCGVGGGPGGVAFGLKLVFKDNVHCFFAEPTHSPCMLLGLMTQLHDKVCVQDFGIDNITEADGLAVGRASGFVGKTLENLISGVYSVQDDKLFELLSILIDTERIRLEPSALAGIPGVIKLLKTETGQKYLQKNNLVTMMKNASHIVWATGGSMVPKDIMEGYYKKGLSQNERE